MNAIEKGDFEASDCVKRAFEGSLYQPAGAGRAWLGWASSHGAGAAAPGPAPEGVRAPAWPRRGGTRCAVAPAAIGAATSHSVTAGLLPLPYLNNILKRMAN